MVIYLMGILISETKLTLGIRHPESLGNRLFIYNMKEHKMLRKKYHLR